MVQPIQSSACPAQWVIFEREKKIGTNQSGPIKLDKHRLVYDGLGIRANRLEHLGWLNKHLSLQTLKAQHLGEWLT